MAKTMRDRVRVPISQAEIQLIQAANERRNRRRRHEMEVQKELERLEKIAGCIEAVEHFKRLEKEKK